MKKILKLVSGLLSLVLICVSFFSINKVNNSSNIDTPTRNVELSKSNVDYESYFKSFDNLNFEIEGNIGTFTGSKKLSDLNINMIDNVSDSNIYDEIQSVDFQFTFNQDTAMVIIEASITSEDGLVSTDSLVGYAFENENEEVDAIITLDDDSTILLSELGTYYVDNCGWLSNLFKTVVSTVVAVVVCAVVPVAIPVIVAATYVRIGIELTEDCFAVRNYYNNKNQTQPTTYITWQSKYKDWKMGNQILSKNGCGAIASYNVMRLLGKTKNLYDIIYYYDCTGGTLAFGYFGVDPTSIKPYFKSQSVVCNSYSSIKSLQSAADDMSSGQYIILCFWNNKDDITEGAHYIAVKKNGFSSYYAYNNGYTTSGSNLKDLFSNGSYIGGWIIG